MKPSPTTTTTRRGRLHPSPKRSATASFLLCLGLFAAAPALAVEAQEPEPPRTIQLTLERMVQLAMSNSYQIRQVNLDVERTRHQLAARQAGLKSRVDLNLQTPDFEVISETKWNSELQRNEIVRENTRRWQADLSIRQPVILFGRPVNGELSLNNRIYRYRQVDDDEEDVRYYNRYFIEYEHRLFQPNELRNNLEEAELNLERAELSFQDDVVELVDDISDEYFELFEEAYQRVIYADYVANLEEAAGAAEALAVADTARALEADQIRIELANAREELQRTRSDFRLGAAEIKQRLRLSEADSIVLDPVLAVSEVAVSEDEAVEFATTLTPRLRQIDISRRMNQIDLEQTGGRGAFRMDLELSYGREKQDPQFGEIWSQPTNSYTVSLNAYVPVWDWGAREERIAAQRIELEQTELRREQAVTEIVSDVRNEIRNLEEFESRALAMEANLALARQSTRTALDRYAAGTIGALELLQSLERESDTAENFLDAYLGWRRALLRLQELTFYDFERGMPVLDRFGIAVPTEEAQGAG